MAISLPILESSWEDGEFVEFERPTGGESRGSVLPAPPFSGTVKRGFWRTIFLGGEGWPFAIAVALAAHVGIAVVGLLFYAAKQVFEGPTLVLPYGWAAEFEGTGPSGTVTYSPSPSPLAALGEMDGLSGAATVSKDLLAPPPGEVETATPQLDEVAIDSQAGTSGDAPIIGIGIDNSAPAVNFRPSPFAETGGGGEGTANGSEQGSGTGAGSADGSGNTKNGTGNSGDGAGDGGGRTGVPEGMAMPSHGNRVPTYPEVARNKRWEGTVIVQIDLDAAGHVAGARLMKSSGYKLLDEEAMKTMRTWTFEPAKINGRPVPVTINWPVNFYLK